VKALYLSRDIAARTAPALGELVGARATEVLPALQSLFLEELHPSGPVQVAIDYVGELLFWIWKSRKREDKDS
jgi:hypothetical protein